MRSRSSAKYSRCTYREGRQRCTFAGSGEPPLCPPHHQALAQAARPRSPTEVLTEATINFLQGKPINREATIGAIENFVDQWAGGIGNGYRPNVDGDRESTVHRRAQAGNQQGVSWDDILRRWGGQRTSAQPPQQDPDAENRVRIAAARQVLGFTSMEVLTVDLVEKRHRTLIKRHHPDLGRTDPDRRKRTELTTRINTARDVLLASL